MIARLNTSSPTRNDHSSAIADHITATGHNIKWDHFEILASGKTDYHCEIKEHCSFISSEKLRLFSLLPFVFITVKNFKFLMSFPDPLNI